MGKEEKYIKWKKSFDDEKLCEILESKQKSGIFYHEKFMLTTLVCFYSHSFSSPDYLFVLSFFRICFLFHSLTPPAYFWVCMFSSRSNKDSNVGSLYILLLCYYDSCCCLIFILACTYETGRIFGFEHTEKKTDAIHIKPNVDGMCTRKQL